MLPHSSSPQAKAKSIKVQSDPDLSLRSQIALEFLHTFEMEQKAVTEHGEQINKKVQELEAESAAQETEIEEFPLPLCCRSFKCPEKLFNHIKGHHDKNATKCYLCEKELSSKSSLDRHLLIHAKWQPYECEKCHKQFSTNGNMHRHRRTTHKEYFDKHKKGKDEIVDRNAGLLAMRRQKLLDTIEKRKAKNQKLKKASMMRIRKKDDVRNISVKDFFQIPQEGGNIRDVRKATYDLGYAVKKQRFIATLGLKEAPEERSLGKKNKATTEHISIKKVKKLTPEGECEENLNLMTDCEKNDFADVTSILSNVNTRLKVGESSDLTVEVKEGEITHSNENFNSSECSAEALNSHEKEHESTCVKELSSDCIDHNTGSNLKNIKSKDGPQKQMKDENKLKSFKCTICSSYLKNKPNAVRHVTKVHKKSIDTAQNFIEYNLDGPQIGNNTACYWCKKEFKTLLNLEHHKRSNPGCDAKPFVCLVCNRKFSTKNNGTRHRLKEHKDNNADCIVPNSMARSNIGELVRNSEDDSTENEFQKIHSPFYEDASQISNLTSQDESSLNNPSDNDEITKNNDFVPNVLQLEAQEETDVSSTEELEVAHSLIKMSNNLHETNEYNFYVNTNHTCSSPVANHPQSVEEVPLDLSIRPIDLTAKNRIDYSEFREVVLNQPVAVNILQPESLDLTIKSNDLPNQEPLNLVTRENYTFNSDNEDSSSLKRVSHPFAMQLINKEIESSKPSIPCDYCPQQLANPSNKRRHERKQHQDMLQSLETNHSRFITAGLRRRASSSLSSSKSLLSKRTKEALLTKFSPKTISSDMDQSLQSNPELIRPLGIVPESENVDLASVSSLINTANTPQLKKYLKNDNNCDITTNSATSEKITERNETPKLNIKRIITKKKGKSVICRVCNKDCKCQSSYKRHFVTHTKEKNHICPMCNTTFTVKSNKERHMRNFHPSGVRSIAKITSSRRRPQRKKSTAVVPSEPNTTDIPTPVELVKKELSQCNKENQQLFISS